MLSPHLTEANVPDATPDDRLAHLEQVVESTKRHVLSLLTERRRGSNSVRKPSGILCSDTREEGLPVSIVATVEAGVFLGPGFLPTK